MVKSVWDKSVILHKKIATEMAFCELNYSKLQLRYKLCVSKIERNL